MQTANAQTSPDISIVIPVYNEEGSIPVLFKEIQQSLEPVKTACEIIFVDDGSTDNSLDVIKELARRHPEVKAVSFKKNFGQSAAIAAGFQHASGNIIITMDADLQNPPEDIPKLVKKINEGWDIVSGFRKNRRDAFLSRKLPSYFANKLISWVTGVHLKDYGCTLKAYRSDIAKNVHLYGEMHRFLPAIAAWQGARICEMEVGHRPRIHGKTKYNLTRTFKVLLDLLTVKFLGSYSTKPIYFFGIFGLLLFLGAFVSAGWLVYEKLAHGSYIIQSPLLILSAMLVILGAQVTLMGLLAEILVRIYYEAREKPTYVIRETLNLGDRKE